MSDLDIDRQNSIDDTDYDYIMIEQEVSYAKQMQEELYLDNYQRSEEDYQSEIARF